MTRKQYIIARSVEHAAGYGTAWIGLCLAAGIHVVDEAATNFLSLYNPTALAIRGRFPWLPVPTFTFRAWITGLIGAIAAALLLSPFAYRGRRWLRPFAYFLAIAMTGNGLLHITVSLYLRQFAPGVYSSPLLLAAALYLLIVLLRTGSLAGGKIVCYANESQVQHAGKDQGSNNDKGSGEQAEGY